MATSQALEAAGTASALPANPSTTDEPRKIASVKRMSALLRSSSAETQAGAGISNTSAPLSHDVSRGDSKVACTDNGKPTTRFALSASTVSRSSSAETGEEISSTFTPLSHVVARGDLKVACTDNGKPTTRFALPASTVTASRVTLSSTRPTSYLVKKAVVEDSDVKYAKAVLEATNEKIRADKLESQVTELLKRVRTADSDIIKLTSEHETVLFGLHTELKAKEKLVLKLQEQLAVANTALKVAASATQEQIDLARQELDPLERRGVSSEKSLDEALLENAELENLCGRHDKVKQWMMILIGVLMYIGIMLGVLCCCLMSRFVF